MVLRTYQNPFIPQFFIGVFRELFEMMPFYEETQTFFEGKINLRSYVLGLARPTLMRQSSKPHQTRHLDFVL